MRHLFLLTVALGVLIAPGCQVTSAALKNDDGRTVSRSIHDINAQRTIRARIKRTHDFKLKGVDVEVLEGVALLSGRVPRPEDRIEAERIAWSAPQVDSIGNEIFIGDKQGVIRNTKDGLLEKTVRSRLIASKTVEARELNVETHNGIVYILGLVDNVEERDKATQIASTTRGAKEVVSYIRVKGLDTQPSSPEASYAAAPQPVYIAPEEIVTGSPSLPTSPLANVPGGSEVTIVPAQPGNLTDLPPALNVAPAPVIPPDAGQGVPFYIDPDNGTRIPVVYKN